MSAYEVIPRRRGRKIRRSVGYGLLFVGFGLLLITSAGEWSSLGNLKNQPARSWELFDRALVERTPTLDTLYDAAQQQSDRDLRSLSKQQAMRVLFTTVSSRFSHGVTLHTPFSNWMLWTLGKAHPALGALRNPVSLLKRSESALCGDISFVLMKLAQRAGIRARHVGLFGHVVMEAWYDDGWHMYDPDYEVVPLEDSGAVLGVTAMSGDEAMVHKVYSAKLTNISRVQTIVEIYSSREDNSFISYPPGSQFEWKTQVLLHMEQASEYLKFIIPLLMVLLGTLVLAPRRAAG